MSSILVGMVTYDEELHWHYCTVCDGYMIWSPGGSSLIWLTNTPKTGLISPARALFFSEMASFFLFSLLWHRWLLSDELYLGWHGYI